MIINEKIDLPLIEGARMMKNANNNKVIDFGTRKAFESSYDKFIDGLVDTFDGVVQYIPVENSDILFQQLPENLMLILEGEDRIYRLMTRYANDIEPYLIKFMEEKDGETGSITVGLIWAILDRYTDIKILPNQNTKWVDSFIRKAFPETISIINRHGDGSMLLQDEWKNALEKDLPILSNHINSYIEMSYLVVMMICEQLLLSENRFRKTLNVEYGPYGTFKNSLIYGSYGGIRLIDDFEVEFTVSSSDTPLDIANRLYQNGEKYLDYHFICRNMINSINIFFREGVVKKLTEPIGEERASMMMECMPDLKKALTNLFMTYIVDYIQLREETIEMLNHLLDEYQHVDNELEQKNITIHNLETELQTVTTKLNKGEGELTRLNKLIGKYQSDEYKMEELKSENESLHKHILQLEKRLRNQPQITSDDGNDLDELNSINDWLSDKTIAIVGGDINWQKKIKETLGDKVVAIHPDDGNANINKLSNVNWIFINTSQLTHELYGKITKYLSDNYSFINHSRSSLKSFYKEVLNAKENY